MKVFYKAGVLLLLVSCVNSTPHDGASNTNSSMVPSGINLNQVSQDPTYGYSEKNPVILGGPGNMSGPESERLYLYHLRDKEFHVFKFQRLGAVGPGPDGHILDEFKLVSQSGNEYIIYLDMYHPDIHPFNVNAPEGMYFWK